ncbi:MAG: ATP-binding domain-containing protein [Syntrophobacteraceae bacterium]
MASQKIINDIAKLVLAELTHFDMQFQVGKPTSSNVFATPPNSEAQAKLAESQLMVHIAQRNRTSEPFIAYVRAMVNNKEKILLICKGYTPGIRPQAQSADFADYNSPIGRAAEQQLMVPFTIFVRDKHINVQVLEKHIFKPIHIQKEWDGIHNRLFLEGGTYSLDSLLAFVREYIQLEESRRAYKYTEELKAIEQDLITEFERSINLKDGLVREVIAKMELRDQPVLDHTQGDIFRLPLSSQIIITGAPGTGKTTTLIKRIAQKTNHIYIDEDEITKLTEDQLSYFFHKQNWIMYIPTEVLKLYMKETFAKELLPASDQRVKVWNEERRLIARDTLQLLRIGDKGFFTSRSISLLSSIRNSDLMSYAKEFERFIDAAFIDEFLEAHNVITTQQTSIELANGFNAIFDKYNSWKEKNRQATVFMLAEELGTLREVHRTAAKALNDQLEYMTWGIIQANTEILDQVSDAIQAHTSFGEDLDSEEEEETDDYGEEAVAKELKVLAKRRIKSTVVKFSRELAQGKTSTKSALYHTVLDLVRSFLPNEDGLMIIGKMSADIKMTRLLTRGLENFLMRIPAYYQQFRIDQLKQEHGFLENRYEREIRRRIISEHEIDLVIFVILKTARKIFDRKPALIWVDTRIPLLENIKRRYVTQIVIDEATDFSSIQLGCMYYLSHPQFTSVAIGGDLMQRVTEYGLEKWEECDYVSNTFEIHHINTVYRQSPKLLCIAKELYERSVGQKAPFSSAFSTDVSDPEPLRFCSKGDRDVLGNWIADRIVEIWMVNGRLPSTAIFVADDELIDVLADIISEPLENHSISVKGCPKGEMIGSEDKVRVFSIKYIKGLEFESVFFVDLDKVAAIAPNLIDKYLYVGLTRAASFLAVTYEDEFPEQIKFVEHLFKEEDWKGYQRKPS